MRAVAAGIAITSSIARSAIRPNSAACSHLEKFFPPFGQRVQHGLGLPGLPREKVLATVVRLLETTFIRIGNVEYARANSSFGLTPLRDRHVEIEGTTPRFSFRGWSGQDHEVEIQDRRNYYVHPAILDAYTEGTLQQMVKPTVESMSSSPEELHPEEICVLALIRKRESAIDIVSAGARL